MSLGSVARLIHYMSLAVDRGLVHSLKNLIDKVLGNCVKFSKKPALANCWFSINYSTWGGGDFTSILKNLFDSLVERYNFAKLKFHTTYDA